MNQVTDILEKKTCYLFALFPRVKLEDFKTISLW